MTTPADRHATEELLPFFVNGTLDSAEQNMVADRLKADPELADQVETLRAIRAQMQDAVAEYSPGAFGLARLMREIEAPAPDSAPVVAPVPVSGPAVIDRRPAFAALAAVVALVAVVAGSVMLRPDAAAPVYYEQASGDAGDAVLTLAFRPDATQADMTDLLLTYGLVMVDGPSALGLYRVQSLEGADLGTLAAELAQQTQIIETVDTLQ